MNQDQLKFLTPEAAAVVHSADKVPVDFNAMFAEIAGQVFELNIANMTRTIPDDFPMHLPGASAKERLPGAKLNKKDAAKLRELRGLFVLQTIAMTLDRVSNDSMPANNIEGNLEFICKGVYEPLKALVDAKKVFGVTVKCDRGNNLLKDLEANMVAVDVDCQFHIGSPAHRVVYRVSNGNIFQQRKG